MCTLHPVPAPCNPYAHPASCACTPCTYPVSAPCTPVHAPWTSRVQPASYVCTLPAPWCTHPVHTLHPRYLHLTPCECTLNPSTCTLIPKHCSPCAHPAPFCPPLHSDANTLHPVCPPSSRHSPAETHCSHHRYPARVRGTGGHPLVPCTTAPPPPAAPPGKQSLGGRPNTCLHLDHLA